MFTAAVIWTAPGKEYHDATFMGFATPLLGQVNGDLLLLSLALRLLMYKAVASGLPPFSLPLLP